MLFFMTQLFNSFFYPSIILYSKYPYQNFDQIICYKSRDNGGIDLDIQFSNNSEIKNAIWSKNWIISELIHTKQSDN